jgi:hypothetical protein
VVSENGSEHSPEEVADLMPDIRLTRDEEKGDLPEVCMCCGQPAVTRVKHTFLLRDPHVPGPSVFWEVFALRLIIASAQAPRLRLQTTFCEQHRHYWTYRSFLVFGGLAGMVAVIVGGLVVAILLLTVAKVDTPWLSCCAIGPFLLFLLVWVIPVMKVTSATIRVRLTEDDAVMLQNVAEGFVTAVQATRSLRPRPAL